MRIEFGLSAAEADLEPLEETLIHLKIWKLISEKEEREQREQETRAAMTRNG
jgi:hypothetical protein